MLWYRYVSGEPSQSTCVDPKWKSQLQVAALQCVLGAVRDVVVEAGSHPKGSGIILGDNLMQGREKKCDSVELLKDVNQEKGNEWTQKRG